MKLYILMPDVRQAKMRYNSVGESRYFSGLNEIARFLHTTQRKVTDAFFNGESVKGYFIDYALDEGFYD